MAQGDWIVPIPGSRKLSRIEENIKASKVILDEVDLKNIKRALDNMDLKAERWDLNSDSRERKTLDKKVSIISNNSFRNMPLFQYCIVGPNDFC